MSPEKLFCVQHYPGAGLADISFNDRRDCQVALGKWDEHAGSELLEGMRIQALFMQERIPLTVQMYNAYVLDQDILVFLRRHCKEVWGGTKLRDSFGVWTGQRRYLVQLQPRLEAPGKFVHPPGSFTIGPDRGYLSYPGQPVYCRRCGGLGHEKATCNGLRCRFCGAQGHQASSCPAPKTCSLCASQEHLFKRCPHRAKTYAEMAAPTGGAVEEDPVVAPVAADGQRGSGDGWRAGETSDTPSPGLHGRMDERDSPREAQDEPSGTPHDEEAKASEDRVAGGVDLGLLMGHLLSDLPAPTRCGSPTSETVMQLESEAPELEDWTRSPFHPGPLESLNQGLGMLVPISVVDPLVSANSSGAMASPDIEMADSPRGCKRGAQDPSGSTKYRLSLAPPLDNSLEPQVGEAESSPTWDPGTTAGMGARVSRTGVAPTLGSQSGGLAWSGVPTANRFALLEGETEGT